MKKASNGLADVIHMAHVDDGILDAIDDDADVYLSVDVDALDRSEMVATGYPSDHGLPLERLLDLVEA